MVDWTVKDLQDFLSQYPPDTKVVGVHTGTWTFGVCWKAKKQWLNSDDEASRSAVSENLDDTKHGTYDTECVVIGFGW